MAKTTWNALIISEGSQGTLAVAEAETQVRITLNHARQILEVYGREGDEDGPLDEVRKMEALLDG